MTFDSKRNGTTKLFAAVDVLEGTVIGQCLQRHRHQKLLRGVFRSIVDLQTAINRFIEDHNAEPKPFVWTANPDLILGKVTRRIQTLASLR